MLLPLPDAHDYEAANDGTANNSSYTEATPRPGTPIPDSAVSSIVPVISGGQNGDLTLTVLGGGTPGIVGGSVEIGYRYASEGIDANRGWCAPNGWDDWDYVTWTTATTTDHPAVCVDRATQRVLVGYGDGSAAPTTCRVWDPATATWDTVTSLANSISTSVAFLQMPNGRVLAFSGQVETYRSDDFGTSWAQHSTERLLNLTNLVAVYLDGEILLCGLSGTTLYQLASSDGGSTFSEVETIATFGTKLNLSALPDGRAVLTYRRNADGYPCSRTVSGAWSPFSDATVTQIKAASCVDVVACADPDGILWAYQTPTGAANGLLAYVSLNGGETWGEFDFGAATVSTSGSDSLVPLRAVSTQGQVMLLCKFIASTGTRDPSICSIRLGGWTNAPYGIPTTQTGLRARTGFGPRSSLSPCVWCPIELPSDAGWTGAGAGTASLSVTAGRLNISTTANARSYSWLPGSATAELVRAGVRVNSGGASGARDVALTVARANGVTEHRIDLRLSTVGFRVWDPFASAGAGATLADVLVDMTEETDLLVYCTGDTAGAYVLWKRPWETVWTEAWSGTLTNDSSGAAAGGIVEFGHISAGTCDSDWRYVARCESTSSTNEGVTTWQEPQPIGRPTSSIPVPLHAETSDGTRVSWLSAVGGVGAFNDTFSLPAAYDYPAEAIYPQISPSPSAPWRSTDKTESIRAYALDIARHLGSSHPGLIALGCNFRTAYLEYLSGTWQTIGTLDLAQGFAGINYVKSGNTITAGSGGVAPGRYLKRNELAGGYAVVETGGGASTAAFRIRGNDEGYWSSSATSRKAARVYLEGSLGSVDASGQCDLVFPSGVLVTVLATADYATSTPDYSRWRVRIPASQVTPDDYYQAGILVPAALQVPGAPPDWGYSEELEPHVIEHTSPSGVSYRRQVGAPTRKITVGWSSGTDLTELRASATDGDWLGVEGKIPMASFEDVAWWADALLEEMRGGEIPCVWLKVVPGTSTTITDTSLYLYGRLTSSTGSDHESGDEDTGEIVRPASWTIEGIR